MQKKLTIQKIAVGDQNQMGALLMSTNTLTYLTLRCEIYEKVYTTVTIRDEFILAHFRTTLVELYTSMLKLVAIASRLLARSTAARSLNSVFNPIDVLDYVTTLKDLEKRVEVDANNCDRFRDQKAEAQAHKLLSGLQEPIIHIDERVISLLNLAETNERLKILDWISNVTYRKRHNTVREQRTKGTCDWPLRRREYQDWQNSSSSAILWLHGTAGTGKTFITSQIIDHVQCVLENNLNHEGLAFFYCNRNESDLRQPLSVLRRFLRQLSIPQNDQKSLPKHIQEFYTKSRQNGSEPTLSDCTELILGFLNLYPKTTLVLDALDECERHTRRSITDKFDYFLSHSQKPVKVFVSSRPDIDIKARFGNRANIRISISDNEEDISRFIKTEIAKHERWSMMDADLQIEILKTLQEGSKGMFQWAYLHIKQLLDLKQANAIRSRLGKLPLDLKTSYDEIYYSMTDNERQIADRAFKWVMCASKPLSSKILLFAVSQTGEKDFPVSKADLDEDLLLEYTRNLLVIDRERDVWIPSHLSVIEYVEEHIWSSLQANQYVATVCLILLSNPSHDLLKLDEQDRSNAILINKSKHDVTQTYWISPLVLYVQQYWIVHIQKCQKESRDANSNRLSVLLEKFLGSATSSSAAYQNWHEIVDMRDGIALTVRGGILTWRLQPISDAMFAICLFGLDTFLPNWWEHFGADPSRVSSSPPCRHSLLQLAAREGHISIFQLLLQKGAKIEAQPQFHEDRSSLAGAVEGRSVKTVQLLLDSGADVNAQQSIGGFYSALTYAACTRDLEMVKLLISSGADVNMRLSLGPFSSTLSAVIHRAKEEMARLLINSGADINPPSSYADYRSVLAGLKYSRDQDMVNSLNSSGADVKKQLSRKYFSSESSAVEYSRNREMLKLSISCGADVKTQLCNKNFACTIVEATYLGDQEMIKLLISCGVDVNTHLSIGPFSSMLAVAAYMADQEMIELLINSGANINMQLQFGAYGSVLAIVASSAKLDIVRTLVEFGADVNARLEYGLYGSALLAAVSPYRRPLHSNRPDDISLLATIQLLIDEGADVNARMPSRPYTALHAARSGPNRDCKLTRQIVQQLLDAGAIDDDANKDIDMEPNDCKDDEV